MNRDYAGLKGLTCKFAENDLFKAIYYSSYTVGCKAPARDTLTTENDTDTMRIYLSNNGRDFTIDEKYFTYYPDPTLGSISPTNGLAHTNQPVVLTGTGFVNSTNAVCKFDDQTVRAVYIDSTHYLCWTPKRGPNHEAEVSVSFNKRDYTTEVVTYLYNALQSGYHLVESDGFTYVKCQVGTFCIGPTSPTTPKQMDISRYLNYTLCPKGSYQQRVGETYCDVCPRGFYCPLMGLRDPLPCSQGYYCERKGLWDFGRPCPPGHYCPDRTDSLV